MNRTQFNPSRPLAKTFRYILAATAFTFALTLLPAHAMADESGDALHPVVEHLVAAWAAGDGDSFAEPFADNAMFIAPNGMPIEGREAIAAGHQRLFDTIYKGSKVIAQQELQRTLAEDLMIVRVLGHNSTDPDGPGTRITLVLRTEKEADKEAVGEVDDRWKIVHAQLTPVQPLPPEAR